MVTACAQAGEGVVLVPGPVLLASANANDYGLQRDYEFSGSGAGGLKLGLIFADRAENVSLTGTG